MVLVIKKISYNDLSRDVPDAIIFLVKFQT